MLSVKDIHKSFDDFKAVQGANLQVDKGSLVALIGPNGAGKTTLFNLITGQLKPNKGEIVFDENNLVKMTPYQVCRKGISRSFQIANIFHRLSVFKNVQVAVLSYQKKCFRFFSPAHKQVLEETKKILKDVGLIDKANDVAGSLSHGDKRILEIAIALGNEPKLLILDEPTAGMSPEETSSTMALIKHLAETKGLTILFCEHDMDVVFNVADSIMVMQQGCTITQGTPEDVRQNEAVQDAYLGGV